MNEKGNPLERSLGDVGAEHDMSLINCKTEIVGTNGQN